MKREVEVRSAIQAGAAGFTTSRTRNHQTYPTYWPTGCDLYPSSARHLGRGSSAGRRARLELNSGVFEIAGEDTGLNPDCRIQDYCNRLKALAVDTGVPVTFGMFSAPKAPDYWRPFFALADETAEAGGRMFIQVHSRPISVLQSFESVTSFDKLPVWRDIRKLSLAEQEAALRNHERDAPEAGAGRQSASPKRGPGRSARRPARRISNGCSPSWTGPSRRMKLGGRDCRRTQPGPGGDLYRACPGQGAEALLHAAADQHP